MLTREDLEVDSVYITRIKEVLKGNALQDTVSIRIYEHQWSMRVRLWGMLGMQALASDPGFVRVSKGVYTLRALAPQVVRAALQPTKPKGQRATRPPPPRFDPSSFPEPAAAAPPPAAAYEDAYSAGGSSSASFPALNGCVVVLGLAFLGEAPDQICRDCESMVMTCNRR